MAVHSSGSEGRGSSLNILWPGPLAGLWYSTPRNPVVEAWSWTSLVSSTDDLLRKCMCLVHSYSSLVLVFRLLSSTSSGLLLLASTSVFSCWAPGFHFWLQLLGSRLPLLSSAVGLLASTSGFSWAPGFYFWLQLLGSRLPILASAVGFPASEIRCWALGFHFWLYFLFSLLPLLGSQLPLLASAVGLLASASNFSFCLPLLGSLFPLLAFGFWLLSSEIDQDQICLLHSEFWLIYPLSSMQGMMGSQQPIRGWHLPP